MIFTVKIFLTDQITEDEDFPPPPIPKQSSTYSSIDQSPPPNPRKRKPYQNISSSKQYLKDSLYDVS